MCSLGCFREQQRGLTAACVCLCVCLCLPVQEVEFFHSHARKVCWEHDSTEAGRGAEEDEGSLGAKFSGCRKSGGARPAEMLLKEYRICMPLTVEEYRIGQLYMISKHSHEQSSDGEGVEVVLNEPFEHPVYGQGQYTEKRLHLNSKLPAWIRGFVPKIFYIIEKAWNYYPYTITEYTCSFLPKFQIRIETKFENNNGCSENVFGDRPTPPEDVCHLDIAFDDLPQAYYKKTEDLTLFNSEKTGRGRLVDGWRKTFQPIMCSYKLVTAKFEVYGFQTRVENFTHKNIRDILLAGHRQAVAWMDEWYGMSLDDVRKFESKLQEETNNKVNSQKTPTDNNEDSTLTVSGGKHSISRSTSWNSGSEGHTFPDACESHEQKPRGRLPSAPE